MSAPEHAQRAKNRLAQETSPYLLQHDDNPVDWYPWGPEALAKAEAEGKPVLLSVGYAACHWCHVMAHESFEDADIAQLMNERFVNIKVDREERPDLDSIYQNALALLGEHGGWPLTMFLTPKGEPFWGGTYFPPSPRFGRPGFPQVLRAISETYTEAPEKIDKNVGTLKEALQRLAQPKGGGAITPDIVDQVARAVTREFDPVNGGLGGAPKFPQPGALGLAWRAWRKTGESDYRDAVTLTLTKMCQGGIYDHLGGGFARYTVDQRWLVPHFEKMLYDNAQLLRLLAQVWTATGDPLYRQRAEETVSWLEREMIALDEAGEPTGAFAATLDADSEGEEGKFYVWTAEEVDALLGEEAALFKQTYDVRPGGNWEGKTILNRLDAPLGDSETEAKLAEQRAVLFRAREERVRPGWDDKVLADWNGLMISALAEAGPILERPDWVRLAEGAFSFIADTLEEDGRLWHGWRRGQRRHAGTLDDHADMIDAALALYLATGKPAYLDAARRWCESVETHFADTQQGGYFTTAADTEDVIVRQKNAHDSATPSGNGVMVGALAKLFYLTGEARYRERAEATIQAFSGELERNAFGLLTLINSADLLNRAVQVAIIGDPADRVTQHLYRAAVKTGHPDLLVQSITPDESLPEGHPAAGKGPLEGRPAAYVCRAMTCSLPITEPDALADAIIAG